MTLKKSNSQTALYGKYILSPAKNCQGEISENNKKSKRKKSTTNKPFAEQKARQVLAVIRQQGNDYVNN